MSGTASKAQLQTRSAVHHVQCKSSQTVFISVPLSVRCGGNEMSAKNKNSWGKKIQFM